MRSTRIVDLPPELLAKILGYSVRGIYESDYSRYEVSHSMHRVVGLTHVCQKFRMVALDCSELWCNTTTEKPEVLEHFFHYSRNRPLHVCIKDPIYDYDTWNYVRSVLPAHCKRIQKLELTLLHHDMRAMLLEIWNDLPLLSLFTLYRRFPNSQDDTMEETEDTIELDAIPLPSLRTINMNCAVIIFPWSSCRNLVQLTLSVVSPALPWSEFTQLVLQSPGLELICLRGVKFYGPIEFDFRIGLPHLMALNLNNIQSSVIFALFRVITTISLTGVCIEFDYDTSLDEVVQLQEAACLGTRTNSHLRLWLSYDNDVSFDATIITEPMHKSAHSIGGPEHLLRVAFDLTLIRNIYVEMSKAGPLDDSTFGVINDDLELTLELCTSALELTITGPISRVRLVLEHLSRPAEEEVQLEFGQPLLCPKIRAIELSVSRDSLYTTNEQSDDVLESFLSSLLVCLAVRTRLGAKLEIVQLDGHAIGPEISGRFKGLVGQLFIQHRRVEIEDI